MQRTVIFGGFSKAAIALLLAGGASAAPEKRKPKGGTDGDATGLDNGIGGTGVVGTIRGFGSIIVNGLRIAYPERVRVKIDGAAARVSDLRVGHVARVIAQFWQHFA